MAEVSVAETCVAEVVAGSGESSLVAAPPAASLSAQVSLATEQERLEALENASYEKSLKIVDGMVDFAKVTPETEEPPDEWVEQLGPAGALEKLRIAKASWMAPKDAPVALTVAGKMVANIAKARAVRDAGRQGLQLNVAVAVFPMQAQGRQYEELVVGDD